MAGKDRTSYKSQVNTDFPSASNITAAQNRTHLQDELADNVEFRLDDTDTQNKTSGAFSIDFTDVDRIETTITGAVGSVVTISNIEDGDVKYWLVTKSATETIDFTGATEIRNIPTDIISAATSLLYRISKKSTTTYVEILKEGYYNENWTTPSLGSPYTTYAGNNVKYRRTNNNQVEMKGAFTASSQSVNTLFTLPSGYRPAQNRVYAIGLSDTILTDGGYLLILVKSDGVVRPLIVCSDSQIHYLNFIFTLD